MEFLCNIVACVGNIKWSTGKIKDDTLPLFVQVMEINSHVTGVVFSPHV